ncbi:MAG: hypothetical protein QXE81_05485 [Desulfurococcaceae archaeon]
MTLEKNKSQVITSYVAGLTALAIVLKLRYFEIPYPPAPFLKYDVSGVPLASIMFLMPKSIVPALLIYYIIHVALGADLIGMAMKCLAELSTITPLVMLYRRLTRYSRQFHVHILVSISVISRVITMLIANIIVTPHWMLIARWASTYEEALRKTFALIPHIILFNATLGIIISLISIMVFDVLKKTGLMR